MARRLFIISYKISFVFTEGFGLKLEFNEALSELVDLKLGEKWILNLRNMCSLWWRQCVGMVLGIRHVVDSDVAIGFNYCGYGRCDRMRY